MLSPVLSRESPSLDQSMVDCKRGSPSMSVDKSCLEPIGQTVLVIIISALLLLSSAVSPNIPWQWSTKPNINNNKKPHSCFSETISKKNVCLRVSTMAPTYISLYVGYFEQKFVLNFSHNAFFHHTVKATPTPFGKGTWQHIPPLVSYYKGIVGFHTLSKWKQQSPSQTYSQLWWLINQFSGHFDDQRQIGSISL